MLIAEVAFPVPVPKAFHYCVPPALSSLAPGTRVKAPFGPRAMIGTVLRVFEGTPDRPLKSLFAALETPPILPAELLETAVWMARRYSAPIGECVKAVLPAAASTTARAKSKKAPPEEPVPLELPVSRGPEFTLTPGQEQALSALMARLEARAGGTALLYGVPASGKTEVYLRLIRKAVAEGGQALFLLPEISLTLPFFADFSAALGAAEVVLWHSRLTPRERREAWHGLKAGRVRVVVGARSAVLLPFSDLRLVVLDEEQDESFKQEGTSPLYHARDVGLHRASSWKALVVLGSATPSIESWASARDGGAERVDLPQRVSAVRPPTVEIVEAPAFGRGCLSARLLEKIRDRLSRREQSILLVNRRGFSTLVMCFKCGWVDRCPECGVAKVQHEAQGGFILRCHHCGASGPVPAACPTCKNPALRVAGTGTQKVAAELKQILPGARIMRMDGDTMSKKDDAQTLYTRFRSGQGDILVGTKLVAKSFHFPEVTLVGVVDADTMLHMPDFRASERTMQMLAQVAGRSGRAEKAGEVVIQTLCPDHEAIRFAAQGDYGEFAERELGHRKELAYPPYSMLVRLILLGANQETTGDAAAALGEDLRSRLPGDLAMVLGPAPAIPPMAQGKYRFHLLAKVLKTDRLEEVFDRVRESPLPSTVRLKVNVDPYDLF